MIWLEQVLHWILVRREGVAQKNATQVENNTILLHLRIFIGHQGIDAAHNRATQASAAKAFRFENAVKLFATQAKHWHTRKRD